MFLIPFSIEKCIFACWFGAISVPSDLFYSQLFYLLKNAVSRDVTPCGIFKNGGFEGTSVLTRATRRNISKDGILHSHLRANLKSYIFDLLIFIFHGAGVESSPLLRQPLIALLYQPWTIDSDDSGAISGMNNWQGKPKHLVHLVSLSSFQTVTSEPALHRFLIFHLSIRLSYLPDSVCHPIYVNTCHIAEAKGSIVQPYVYIRIQTDSGG
jgi:hypothetical protein